MKSVTDDERHDANMASFVREVSEALGPAAIRADADTCAEYGQHTLPDSDHVPSAVVYPDSTEAVQTLVRLANKHSAPLFPISMGRSTGLGSRAPMRSRQVVVDLGRRMNRIIEVNEELGYCVIEPGVTFNALHDKLRQLGDNLMMSATAGPPDGSVLGNALEKGGGAGPLGSHFDNLCGLEAVLGNGDIVRTGDGGLDAEIHPNVHVTKYSFGPVLDGLFSQSNYGIVTRAGMWLMRRPAHIRMFFFVFPDDDDVAEIIDRIRALKMANAVPTMIRATNDLYLLSSQTRHPRWQTSPCSPVSDAERRELHKAFGSGAWTVSGALYGDSEVTTERLLERVRAAFEASGKAQYIPDEKARTIPHFHAAINSNSGWPAGEELAMLKWRPGGGAIWFTPGVLMTGAIVNELQRICRKIVNQNGLDYMASFVCGQRFARSVHAILYNRSDPDERERADQCYRMMSEAFRERGIFVGRAPTSYQAYHHAQRTRATVNVCTAIKNALDPNGIIAPGRYGIE
jgi:4-cresol dehydrogenase (hydroxylating)